jgi:hypothetical protein
MEKTMKNQKVVLRFDEFCTRDKYGLRRIEGTVTADSLVRLIDAADLEANPREAKVGEVTTDIQDSLETTPKLFPFKTKGLLLASSEATGRERNRFELAFEDGDVEGVLDGGHNLLAIALFILKLALGSEADAVLKRIKRWKDLPPVWRQYRDKIDDVKDNLDFLTPVEVIYPQEGAVGRDEFLNAVLDIARARNNNAELTEETKANKAGLYDALKGAIDPVLADQIEWKSGDGGRIKARDLIALSWVALSKLGPDFPGVKDVSAVSIYNSKGGCVSAFNTLMESDQVTKKTKGDIRELNHEGVKSAFALMRDLPRLYDRIYSMFPDAYNRVSPGFGRIRSVYVFDPGRSKSSKDSSYLAKPPKTKFYRLDCKYDFPDGFIMPLVWALRELIKNEDGMLLWAANPDKFLERHLEKAFEVYLSVIQLADYDPQRIGKSVPSYQLASNDFQSRLNAQLALEQIAAKA